MLIPVCQATTSINDSSGGSFRGAQDAVQNARAASEAALAGVSFAKRPPIAGTAWQCSAGHLAETTSTPGMRWYDSEWGSQVPLPRRMMLRSRRWVPFPQSCGKLQGLCRAPCGSCCLRSAAVTCASLPAQLQLGSCNLLLLKQPRPAA